MRIDITTRRILIKISILVMLFFLGIMFVSYATDTYSYITLGFADGAYGMLYSNGRAITALAFYLCHLCGTTYETFYSISYVIADILLIAAIYVLERMMRPIIHNENWRILVATLCIVNPFIIEYYMFIEKFSFVLSIFLYVLGAYYTIRYYETHRLQYILLAIVSLFVAMFGYQASIGLYAILAVPFAFYNAMQLPELRSGRLVRYLQNLVCIGITFLAAIGSYMLVYNHVIHGERIGLDLADTSYLSMIKHTLYQEFHVLRTTYDILPHGMLLGFAVIVILLILLNITGASLRYWHALHLAITIATVLVFSVAAVIGSAEDYKDMRLVYPIASLVGVLLLDLYIVMNDARDNSPSYPVRHRILSITQFLSQAIIVILLAVTLVGFNRIYHDKYQCNYADRMRCMHIGNKIADYESETGNKIEYIVFYSDADATAEQYPGLYYLGDLNTSSFMTDWSDRNAINYYLGTHYKRTEQDPEYIEYFSSQDWDHLSDEQMVFDGDTLHYCIY